MGAARPDILLVTMHDLGRHLPCYGARGAVTPAIDRLARRGVVLERAFAASAQCSPSRSALATGRHPHANGVMGLAHEPFGWDLHPGERHLAQLLGEAGYDTHLFGHQHVTLDVGRLGFGELHGIEHRACEPAERVGARVGEWLRGHDAHERAWYCEVNLDEPHRPWAPDGCVPGDADPARGVFIPAWLDDEPAVRGELSALATSIERADAAIAEIVDTLEQLGRLDETVVLVTTDHGLAMPRAKCTMYDAGIGIAMLASWPRGGVRAGARVNALVSNVDVVPTLLDAAGVESPANLHGRSFLGELRGDTTDRREAVYAGKTFHSYYDPMRAIRTDRWKLVRNFDTGFAFELPGDIEGSPTVLSNPERWLGRAVRPDVELYDLSRDPDESTSLADDVEHAALREDLERRLHAWMAATGDPLLEGPVPSPSWRRSTAAIRGRARST